MTTIKWHLKTISILCMIAWLASFVFADNVIWDVPASANENRTIQRETTLYNWSCDLTQELAFYQWSPVYLRVWQPKGQVSYVFDKTETYVRVYNQSLFAGTLKFPYISNFVPSTTIDSTDGNILTVDATWSTFVSLTTITRNQPAWQFVTVNNERSVIQNNNWATLNYYYVRANDLSVNNGTMKVMLNPTLTTKKSCTSYYVARCGDGIIDKATGNSDGNGGITTQWWTFLAWHTISIKPNEVCDDWTQNGQAGKCKTDCTGIGWWTETGNLVVTKTLTVEQNYAPGDNLQFRISFSNPSTQTVQNISIEDFLPNGLQYISSEINWATAPVYFSTGIFSGTFTITYTGFSLAAGQNGYILVNAKLLSCNEAMNIVKWVGISNGQSLQGNTAKQVICSSTPVSITKTASQSTVQWWQSVQFTITANNATPNTITNIFIQDTWPSCFFFTGTAESTPAITPTQHGNMTQWALSSLAPWQSLTIRFYGQAKTDPSCVGAHTNTAKIIYNDAQQIPSTATVTITPASQPTMSIRKEVIQAGVGPRQWVRYLITYKNESTTTPIVWFTVRDIWPSTLIFRWSDPSPTTMNPYTWVFNSTLQPLEEWSIEIKAEIKSDL